MTTAMRLGLLLVLSTACSGTSPSGTSPAPPPPPPPPPAPVASVAVTPPQASVEAGATVQLTAQPRDGAGNALAGRAVSWSTDNPAAATVDQSGLVSGVQAGTATITATSEGRNGTATIQVTAPTPVVITQIAPATLIEGQPATISGTGFGSTAAANTVTIGGVTATIAQASATSLTVTVPVTCLPKGAAAAVEVRVGTKVSGPATAPISPAGFATLAIGQQVVIESGAFRCLQLDGSGAERYLIGVQSTTASTDLTAVSIEGDVPGGAGGAPLPALAAPAAAPGPRLGAGELRRLARWRQHLAATGAAYDAEREPLQRLARRAGPATAPALVPSVPGTVKEGDVVSVRVPVFGGSTCTQFETISGLVRRITAEAIFVEDQANPVPLEIGVLDQAGTAFGPIHAIDIDHFGQPGDIDGNGRIVIVITKEVNRRPNPPLGFVSGGNALLTTACASSNEGEYFYTRSPDPNGVHPAGVYTAADLSEDFTNLLAHELAHIIQVARRRAVNGQFMASFVAEGLATAAQEVVGMQLLGLAAGSNYGRNTVYTTYGADPRAFFGYLGDLLAYFGFDFSGSQVTGAPEQCTWSGGTQPGTFFGPCSFAIRLGYGVSWTLIKHAIDRHHGGAAGQKAILRAFSEYPGPAGYPELEAVLGRPLGTLLAQWAPMLYLDDRAPLLADFQMANWNVRSVASAWGSPSAELRPRVRGFADFTDAVTIRGGSTAFYDVSGSTRPGMTFRVRAPGRTDTPAGIGIWAVRVQ